MHSEYNAHRDIIALMIKHTTMKNLLLILFSLSMSSMVLGQTVKNPEPLMMYWGKKEFRLFRNNFQNNAYSGQFVLTQEEMVKLLNEPISFKRKGGELNLEGFNAYLMGKDNSFNSFGMISSDNTYYVIDDNTKTTAIEKILPSARLYFNAVRAYNVAYPNLPMTNIQFTIADTAQTFKAPVQIAQNDISDVETFTWQMVEDDDGHMLMRGDTTSPAVQKWKKFYGNNPKYSFMHIPGFQTLQRIVGPAYRTSPLGAETRTIKKIKTPFDIWKCKDYIGTANHQAFYIEWGTLQLRNFAYSTYEPEYFMSATKNQPIRVNVKDKFYDVLQVDCTMYYPDGNIIRVLGNGDLFKNWSENLPLDTKNMVYVLEDLMIKDDNGEAARLPFAFIVRVEKN
jgi:hypothetical protein